MLTAVPFVLPLIAGIACLALNRVVPTRWCAFGCAVALLTVSGVLVAVRSPSVLTVFHSPWLTLNGQPVDLLLQLTPHLWPILLAVAAGGALGLAALGLALPGDLRGYAGLPAAVLLVILLTMLGIANGEPLLEPAVWMLAALASALALRASGAAGSDAPLVIGLAGSIATALAVAAALLARESNVTLALLCMLAGIALIAGLAPFHASMGAFAEAPAAVGGVLVALGLPMLGGVSLLRVMTFLPATWHQDVMLLGMLSFVACAAGALRERRLRRTLIWQHGAQQGLVVVAAAQGAAQLATIAPLLIMTAALSTLAAGLATSDVERRGDGDDLTLVEFLPRLTLAGLALLVAGATAVGAPGTAGFWARIGLLPGLQGQSWALAGLLAGTALLAASYLAPVAALWRGTPQPRLADGPSLLAVLAALGLLILAVVPFTLQTIATTTRVLAALVALALLAAALILLRMPRRRLAPDSDTQGAGAAFPAGLADSLGWLAAIATPSTALGTAWDVLVRMSSSLSRQFVRFEQRYYLAGLLIALIIVILVFI